VSRPGAVTATLALYLLALVVAGWAARRRASASAADYYLGGRSLGPWVAALSASASSSSAWSLLGVSGAAFSLGGPAVWILPGCLGGFAVNWFFVAPRLRRRAAATGALTLTDVLATDEGGRRSRAVAWTASGLVLVSLGVYVAAQLQGAGGAFSQALGLDRRMATVAGAVVVLAYTVTGGFLAASWTDALQAFVMAASAIVLPVVLVAAAGGPGAVIEAASPFADPASGAALAMLGIGLGYPGQPHVVNRFMAARDEAAIRTGRWISLGWAAILYTGMIALGWAARAVHLAPASDEDVLLASATAHLPPVAAGVVVAAVLSAVMSTVDSQLLVAGSAASHDLRGTDGRGRAGARRARYAVAAVAGTGLALALGVRATIFERVLFAWDALGAAFGPALVWTLAGSHPGRTPVLVAMAVGAGAAIGTSLAGIGGATGRLVPYALASVALAGAVAVGRRRGGRR